MKKALFYAAITSACTALGMNAQAGDITFTYTQNGSMDSQPASTIVKNVSGSWNLYGVNGEALASTFNTSGLGENTSIPGVEIGAGKSWKYTLTFTPVADTTIDSIKVAYSIGNAANSNVTTNQAHKIATTATLNGYGFTTPKEVSATGTNTRGSTSTTYTLNADWTSITSGSGTIITYDFGSDLTLKANNAYTFTVLVELGLKDGTDSFRVGLDGIRLNTVAVPEPATATLSLLALAGLAARRRRK